MDELIKQGQWWWLLIPLGTGVFALVGSWTGALLGKTTEHKQWLRNEKLAAYSNYTETVRKADYEIRSVISGATDIESRKYNFPGHKLYLIAPKSVQDAAEFHRLRRRDLLHIWRSANYENPKSDDYEAAVEALDDARGRLIDAMAADLGIVGRH